MAPKPKYTTTDDLPKDNPFAPSKGASRPPPRKVNIVRSGTAGNSSKAAASLPVSNEPPAPPPLFPAGYKTPLSLLTERCQKEGWDKPSVEPKKVAGSSMWSASVALRRKHPKTGLVESVYMRPPPAPSPIAVEKSTAMEAKHFGALYALYRFANNLQLRISLPPSTRDYWSALEAEKAASTPNKLWLWSTTPFETAAAAPVHPPPPPPHQVPIPASNGTSTAGNSPFSSLPSSRSATPNPSTSTQASSKVPLSKHWLEAPEVRMPSALRDLVEQTIRTSMPSFASAPATNDDGEPLPLSPNDTSTVSELTKIGWRKGHVLSALAYTQQMGSPTTLHNLLSHLHLHTPESDLPLAFRSSKPADANARIATSNGSEELARRWRIDEIVRRTGVPRLCVETAWEEVTSALDDGGRKSAGDEGEREEEGIVIALVTRRLVGWTVGAVDDDLDDQAYLDWIRVGAESEEREGLAERREDEILGLEGMFGTNKMRRTDEGVEIIATSPTKADDIVTLRVLFHPHSAYPSPSSSPTLPHLPTFYVHSASLPPYLLLHLTSLLMSRLVDPAFAETLDLVRGGYGGVINELVTHLSSVFRSAIDSPPDAREVLRFLEPQNVVTFGGGAAARGGGGKKKEVRRKAYRPPATMAAQQAMKRSLEANAERKAYGVMEDVRRKLPAWDMRDQIVQLIENNRVVIVSGETGSGKTTQVPSFVLDNAIAHLAGASTNIIVTQPRRVSAIGVATRVAAERLEDINDANSRSLIGYAIRGERKAGKDTRLLFCTTGVVLARLSRGGDPNLEDVSHIFIDEVHERSVDSDFLLIALRDILQRNKKIKIILMSATINQAQFSDYFGGAPCIEIPGFMHPVQDHYLEEILPNLPSSYQPTSRPSKKLSQPQIDRMRASFMARGIDNERTLSALESLTRSERIDYNLVGAVARYCIEKSKGTEGGVLVFMPGVFEIKQAVEAIRSAVPHGEQIEVFPLHANLSSDEQKAVFRPVRAGHRKIIVATNVAETSITIDGIVYVIDAGRVKENTFDPETGITRLVETWTSKASSRQRRGRAGRTRPGQCFKLFSHYTEETTMANHPTPEIVRIPLEMLCLQIKAMRDDEDVKEFLSKAITPPDLRSIDSAVTTLRDLGAIEEEGGSAAKLTPLGAHLAMIPVDLRLGKMLVLASIFRCLDPILTVVAILSSKPFFLNPMDKREEAKKARSMYYTSRSDLLSDVQAFHACLAARSQSNSSLRIFAEDNFISLSTFRDILNLRSDYLTALSDVGFVPFRASPSAPALNENSTNENLLKAIIFAGTGRLVKIRLPPTRFDKGISGTVERERLSKEVKYYERESRVFLHPGSLLFEENRFATPFITYFSKHVTTKPFLRDATEVPLYAVLLFGAKVSIDLQRGLTVGDGWVMMRAWPRIGVLVNALRQLFDLDLEANIEDPSWDGQASPVVGAMLALLERDGGLY